VKHDGYRLIVRRERPVNTLVGPRPLLPRDQPKNIEIRLMVRPGITGWAQVNGGVLLSPDEKERLDE
jgi:lipopolysaccharide/colanic/teichoic acid biosynthesis glycosyltransferase